MRTVGNRSHYTSFLTCLIVAISLALLEAILTYGTQPSPNTAPLPAVQSIGEQGGLSQCAFMPSPQIYCVDSSQYGGLGPSQTGFDNLVIWEFYCLGILLALAATFYDQWKPFLDGRNHRKLFGYLFELCLLVGNIMLLYSFISLIQPGLDGIVASAQWSLGQIISLTIWVPIVMDFFHIWACKLERSLPSVILLKII